MKRIKFKIGGAEFEGGLSVAAIETVERAFDGAGIVQILSQKQSLSGSLTIIRAAVAAAANEDGNEDPSKKLEAAVEKELSDEGEGFAAIFNVASELLRASGMMGKKAARGKG